MKYDTVDELSCDYMLKNSGQIAVITGVTSSLAACFLASLSNDQNVLPFSRHGTFIVIVKSKAHEP